MPTDYIPFRETNYFSSLICDYLDEQESLTSFYHRFPNIENFKFQIEEKQTAFTAASRSVLVKALKQQYESFKISEITSHHIDLLQESNSFTITTGHQLNLFTGPLYFFYKIVSVINLCDQLKSTYPEYNFVPVYWMATEDHDFDEINFFNFQGKKVQWNRSASGAVGELDLEGLDHLLSVYSNQIGDSINAKALQQMFKEAYQSSANLADAMRYLVNILFGDHGLVIVDGNDTSLKAEFIPYIKDELFTKSSYDNVSMSNSNLNKLEGNYKIQVNPRDINLFYIKEGLRERIVENNGHYRVNSTEISWTKEQLEAEVESHPERFSPNVIVRPLYQEVILPNLCYIGGGGELAYWLQLKSNFESQNVVFPILLLRNSVLLISNKQEEKLNKLNCSVKDLFRSQHDLKTKVTKQISEIDIDFSSQKSHLEDQFKSLYKLAEQTEKSFLGAVAAQERKQIKGLEKLEKRLLKAQKRKLKDHLDRVTDLQDQLFPMQSLQERNMNFSEFYLEKGDDFLSLLMDNLKPLKSEFLVLTI